MEPSPPPLADILNALRTARLSQVVAPDMYHFVIASKLLGQHVDNLLDHHEKDQP